MGQLCKFPSTHVPLGAKTAEAPRAESPEAEMGGGGPLQLPVLGAVEHVMSGAAPTPRSSWEETHVG